MKARAAALSMTACLLAFAPDAGAHGGGTSPIQAPTPPAPPGDGAAAERIIKDIEAGARDERAMKVVAEPMRQAKKALGRAHDARAAGDAAHARMLDGLALEWAETARDLVRAVAAEDAALAAAKQARALDVQVERARALLEETQARHGRAVADLERVEAEAQEVAKKAAVAEEERIEKGSKKQGAGKGPKGVQGGKPAPADKKPSVEATKKGSAAAPSASPKGSPR